MKKYDEIAKWGRIKPFFAAEYSFNALDLETIDNELFIIGVIEDGVYNYTLNNFYEFFHEFLINSIQNSKDILTWTRYDNTHLLKLILSKLPKIEVNKVLERVGKISPILSYSYGDFSFVVENIIRDSIVMKIIDKNKREKSITIYNLKNLYDSDLLTTAKNYKINYSKLGEEYHIIDKIRFFSDEQYKKMVLKSNFFDCKVLIEIAQRMLEDFKVISGQYPRTIFSTGSLARSYLLSQKSAHDCYNLNFLSLYQDNKYFYRLLEYSMSAYHGGKIESYILGYVPKAKTIDISSAYPYSLSLLPQPTQNVIYSTDESLINNYFYVFIKLKITIPEKHFIHPVVVENPINKSNISPFGTFQATITKPEFDFLRKNAKRYGITFQVIDFVAIEHEENYPYREMVYYLFEERLKCKKSNPSLSQLYKIILNSLYGITFELTDIYVEDEETKKIEWLGYRAGDFFNPIIASYITSLTRTYLSDVSNNIEENGGKVFLNMTDSIIYDGNVTLDVFSEKKTLGKFEPPTSIENLIILGAGRYEYKNEFNQQYIVKSRGFNVLQKDKSFYAGLDLNKNIKINHRTFVTPFKATTKKYNYKKMGYLIDDDYEINPFNLGGKRLIDNYDVDLNHEFTTTSPVELEEDIVPYYAK